MIRNSMLVRNGGIARREARSVNSRSYSWQPSSKKEKEKEREREKEEKNSPPESTSTSNSTSNSSLNAAEAEQVPFTSSLSRVSAESNSKPLPFLSTPLGVPTAPPRGGKLSWIERRDNYFDPKVRDQRRKAIVKEATRGYFHDFHNLRSHGGKTWRSSATLIKEERALYFPNVSGTCLSDRSTRHTADILPGKVSVVSLLSSKISEEHTRSFYEPTLETFQGNKHFQLVQIPKSLHETYLLSSNSLELEKEALGLHNKHVGYVYLVGTKGEIRWAGGAFAEREERDALRNCTGVLLGRIKS